MEKERLVRVAIVGSGMAGLVTAYLLQRDERRRYDVKVFESGSSLSLDSASISIPKGPGVPDDRVDLPMRAFAGGYYNNLRSMYDHLGVKYHNQPFVFEFAKAPSENDPGRKSEDQSYFVYASNLHKLSLPRLDPIGTISYFLEALYLLVCYVWFSLCCFFVAPRTFEQGNQGAVCETLDQYLRRIWLPRYFTTYYLVPLISSVATCPHQSLLSFPASDLIDYKRQTHRAPHFTVSNGVKTVQERLAKGIQYELSAVVTAVVPQGQQVKICWQKAGGGNVNEEVFDRVILAVTPDVVGKVFEPLRHQMAVIPTAEVESVVHTDRKSLQGGKDFDSDSAQLIYLRTSTDGNHRTESLHVQPCGAIVTTCPFDPIDPALTIQAAKFTRVLRSPESRRVVNGIFGTTSGPGPSLLEKAIPSWQNGDDNVWLVGGWCWDGMVLLEGCVVSAMRVARAFDVEVPWRR